MRINLTGFSRKAILVFLISTIVVSCAGCKKKVSEESKTEPGQSKVDVSSKSLDASQELSDSKADEQPAQQETQLKSRTEREVESAKEYTTVTSTDKLSLREIIRNRRTWNPIFTSWYGVAAPNFTLTDINGKKHKLSDYQWRNVLIIFWATWCRPCHIEIPHLIELRNTVGEDKLVMLAISSERENQVKKFTADKKLNYTVFSYNTRAMSAPYSQVAGIPSAIFISPEGKMKLATEGLVSFGEIKAILQANK